MSPRHRRLAVDQYQQASRERQCASPVKSPLSQTNGAPQQEVRLRVLGLLRGISEQADVEICASERGITRVILGDKVTLTPAADTAIMSAPTHSSAVPRVPEGEENLGEGGHAFTTTDTALRYAHQAAQEIAEYLHSEREHFSVPLTPTPTSAFTTSVHEAIAAIPYGQRLTYAELAHALGKPGATRAVGTACGKNPLPILVPCHRVVRADGSLGRYTGGDAIKGALLAIEGRP